MKVYGTPAEALEDAMRLSAAMTRKLAVAGLPFGGGKAVIAVPEIPSGERRRALFLRYGDLVASLGGTFRTSSDMNTGEADMDVIGERTEYVFGRSVKTGGSGNPAAPTAVGVYHGIRATLSHAFGSEELEGRIVLVQGAGGVGSALADQLANAGASILVADIDAERALSVAVRAGGTTVSADQVFETDCDVYAPCAVGGILSAENVPRLRCRIVAGSANNQLAQGTGGRTVARAGDPVRARLSDQRRRSHRARRSGAARLDQIPARRGACRDRRDAGADLRAGRHTRHLNGGRRRRACGGAAESALAARHDLWS
jgi:leucine dehydrogenase